MSGLALCNCISMGAGDIICLFAGFGATGSWHCHRCWGVWAGAIGSGVVIQDTVQALELRAEGSPDLGLSVCISGPSKYLQIGVYGIWSQIKGI